MSPESTSRYASVTRRAFLGGLSLAAIAGAAGCAASSTATSAASTATSTPTATTATATATSSSTATASGKTLPTSAKATVSWTYAASSGGGGMKNPYMAVWIEDSTGAFVKTLVLYHLATNDRWLNTLSSWYSSSGGTDTTTSGTVPAGSFTTSWDGSTAAGARATQGAYYVCVESVVEHGSESLVRQQVTFGTSAAKTTLTASGNISAAAVDYTV